jgi:hypothetical protein
MQRTTVVEFFRNLWRDECGALAGADYILAITILVIGGITGLVTVRDAAVQNLGDIAVALESLDQSYTVTIEQSNGFMLTFGYVDPPIDPELVDLPGQAPHGIELCQDLEGPGTEN